MNGHYVLDRLARPRDNDTVNFPCGHERPTPPCRHCAVHPSRSSRRHFLRFLGAGAVAAVGAPIIAPVMIQVPRSYVTAGDAAWVHLGQIPGGVGAYEFSFSYNVKSAFWLAT